MTLQRIVIIGTTGSGKTTLCRKLSAQLGIPAIDLDDIYWLPGWQERGLDEARGLVDAATQKPAWVISGNYRQLQDVFWPRADTLIWLDYSFSLVFCQLLKRSLNRILDRQSICNGNYETWRKFFSKDSIIIWLFKSFWRRKRECGEIFAHPERYARLRLMRFRHPSETEAWLKSTLAA